MSDPQLAEVAVETDPGALEDPGFDVQRVRRDFPILQERMHGKPLVYLDNAATAQKPRSVIQAISRYYQEENANVHRGVYKLSELASEAYEGAREYVRSFINAASKREIVFTRGTTESINLVAATFGRKYIGHGDEVLISELEHHSNIVPWQILCEERGALLKVVPINDRGELEMEQFYSLLSPRTKIVAVAHISNSLGTINPVQEIIAAAHAQGTPVLLDGAQAVPHTRVDVRALDCDFYCFSGHKTYGPTGIGVLYAKQELLESMPPYQSGGDMINSVSFEKTTYNELPYRFEAGTPHIAGAVGLKAALAYIERIGYDTIEAHERELLAYATEVLQNIESLRIIGTAARKAAVISFDIDGIHPHDVGTILDRDGIAVRTGHHCTQPVMAHFDIPATSRASFAIYNTKEEIDALVAGIHKLIKMFH